jgi:hypothetical protein
MLTAYRWKGIRQHEREDREQGGDHQVIPAGGCGEPMLLQWCWSSCPWIFNFLPLICCKYSTDTHEH